jgi:hypothetical protein
VAAALHERMHAPQLNCCREPTDGGQQDARRGGTAAAGHAKIPLCCCRTQETPGAPEDARGDQDQEGHQRDRRAHGGSKRHHEDRRAQRGDREKRQEDWREQRGSTGVSEQAAKPQGPNKQQQQEGFTIESWQTGSRKERGGFESQQTAAIGPSNGAGDAMRM